MTFPLAVSLPLHERPHLCLGNHPLAPELEANELVVAQVPENSGALKLEDTRHLVSGEEVRSQFLTQFLDQLI